MGAFDSTLNNAFPPSLIPHQKKHDVTVSNYLSFNGGAGAGDSDTFAQQYLT